MKEPDKDKPEVTGRSLRPHTVDERTAESRQGRTRGVKSAMRVATGSSEGAPFGGETLGVHPSLSAISVDRDTKERKGIE